MFDSFMLRTVARTLVSAASRLVSTLFPPRNDRYFPGSTAPGIETSLDAADTSVRATYSL
jgi:hypothetical protein